MKPIRILLADDHTLVRAGICSLIKNMEGTEVIAEAGDGREALRLVRTHRPDVVLMDVAMPGLNGLEATARIAKKFPHVRVIILSMHINEEYVLQALRAGAAGYLVKGADAAELEIAIRAVARGETYLSPTVSKHVVTDYIQRISGETTSLELLTPRQREVLQLIAEGYSTKKIASTLKISVKTVETHRMQLMERLDIHDIAGLVRYAIRVGLVKPDQ
ncbi:MAG: DNA-binding response regulator [Candidatus Dadabacteria bacterium RBG_19FT_COMBO_40_33]|nr:MAG: DNA-binding response regulator [Candidatus Dadabacteria bacterium RBG_19FT_COMBO_40_33]